jgi:site-specific DNA-cytosine methylase
LWADGIDEPKREGKQASATAKKRRADNNRKYSPWAYETDAMLHDGKNNLHHVTADEAGRLHHFPDGWAFSANADEKTRLLLIGNA